MGRRGAKRWRAISLGSPFLAGRRSEFRRRTSASNVGSWRRLRRTFWVQNRSFTLRGNLRAFSWSPRWGCRTRFLILRQLGSIWEVLLQSVTEHGDWFQQMGNQVTGLPRSLSRDLVFRRKGDRPWRDLCLTEGRSIKRQFTPFKVALKKPPVEPSSEFTSSE
jgi:hypothetical protein